MKRGRLLRLLARHALRHHRLHDTWTSTAFGLAFSLLGRCTLSTPSLNSALTFEPIAYLSDRGANRLVDCMARLRQSRLSAVRTGAARRVSLDGSRPFSQGPIRELHYPGAHNQL